MVSSSHGRSTTCGNDIKGKNKSSSRAQGITRIKNATISIRERPILVQEDEKLPCRI